MLRRQSQSSQLAGQHMNISQATSHNIAFTDKEMLQKYCPVQQPSVDSDSQFSEYEKLGISESV